MRLPFSKEGVVVKYTITAMYGTQNLFLDEVRTEDLRQKRSLTCIDQAREVVTRYNPSDKSKTVPNAHATLR